MKLFNALSLFTVALADFDGKMMFWGNGGLCLVLADAENMLYCKQGLISDYVVSDSRLTAGNLYLSQELGRLSLNETMDTDFAVNRDGFVFFGHSNKFMLCNDRLIVLKGGCIGLEGTLRILIEG
ncbi:hypothetical protein METBIDRAFT_32785 [Metschnikowia bicuspidata var. bicuspidata NRRL YB-4993]|uniref:Uncharacterized protein n=1 Tax=Metschnikowia bicuspidata var. bicuspidata NRRL YB-4993 TaxID=869754 RepID=A0A1A0H6J7_9ASCO|nr:hypothetical protein METBIDRAFT_32785 [Metschnikowia bicuspidata var. bicuspidata NRRL YB-4993]OBA19709.1 hypothetical protein METBIDRAFT_32785 [Metschnikowia bicuspidata var. bicuspidata NRRL YB-4993]